MYNTEKTMAQTIVSNIHVKLFKTIAFLIAKKSEKFPLQLENLIHGSNLNANFFVFIYFCRFLELLEAIFDTRG